MSRKRKVLLASVISGTALVTAAILLLGHYMGGAATGTVHVGTPVASSAKHRKPTQALPLDTAYFTATLPAGFVLKQNTATPNADIFLLRLTADTDSTVGQQFAATIGVSPTGGIAETSDYHLRATQTDTYQPYHPSYLPAGATAFHSVSGAPSVTVFLPRGTTYGEVTLSTEGGATENQLDTSAKAIFAGWSWK
ncbi:MAG TPA: hypothetical protein VLF59_03695 [Candidatus Saccharimonadales bacterium]|nr:hypothetical protein [Candidatus Saccharimonadales bacterium]